MAERRGNMKIRLYAPLFFYLAWLGAMLLAGTVLYTTDTGMGWLLLGFVPLLIYLCRPASKLHRMTAADDGWMKKLCTLFVALATVAACILPMGQLPLWNGEIPGHRNQYELMAENLLEGRLHFDYGDEDQLLELKNPYDPKEREESGVMYHWDHAYYNGRYYMYFGVVPVILVFLPYRVLTGQALTTYHGTQIFAAAAILGIFTLFQMLSKRFFKGLPHGVCLAMAAAVSVMSLWNSTAEPALYCTAITAAIALQIWSLYFFIKAVWVEHRQNRQIALAGIGALFGALVFGCRPPVAFANLLAIPMLAVFLKQHKFSLKLLGKLVLVALPYVIVAVALMLYNYVRFDNPFEFGQAYQLTVADQTQYGLSLDAEMIVRLLSELKDHFFGDIGLSGTFPYLGCGGAFSNFPMLLLLVSVFRSASAKLLKKEKLVGTMCGFSLTVIIITLLDIMWTPYLLERYHMDIYFLMGIACFIAVGIWHETSSPGRKKNLNTLLVTLSLVTVIGSCLFCFATINVYYPDTVQEIARLLVG